jgi:hypothetical protein
LKGRSLPLLAHHVDPGIDRNGRYQVPIFIGRGAPSSSSNIAFSNCKRRLLPHKAAAEAIWKHADVLDAYRCHTGVFCPECGVRIYQVLKSVPEAVSLKPGTLDYTSWFRPNLFI